TTLQSAETLFHQDLNGDGQVGIPGAYVIENNGTTTLESFANENFLQDSRSNSTFLRFQGAPVVAGQFAPGWPIAAEETANGYEVAWKQGTGPYQYSVWNIDFSGNYLNNAIGAVSGTDPTLESAETLFQQDLNGDGQVGVPVANVLESVGATK